MKSRIAILLLTLTLLTGSLKSQITLEQDYPASATLTELAVSGYKYYLMDVMNNECRIYSTDHSIWKIISLNMPSGMYLYDIRFVSEKLFNNDDKVELAYIYYSYDTSLYYYTYYARVIDETGAELLDLPGCAFLEVKSSGNEGYKMLAYVYDYSIVNWTVNTLVYSLPGSLPVSAVDSEIDAFHSRPFPNPAGATVTIPCQLPEGMDTGEISLMNSSGLLIRKYEVDRTFGSLLIHTGELTAGIYIYTVTCDKTLLSSGKIIVPR